MRKLLIQAFEFFGISGIGWIIDMSIYTFLSSVFNMQVMVVNILSSLVAVTFVYITSTKKLFENNSNKFSVKKKYILYIIYQIIMILLSSYIIGSIAVFLPHIKINIITKYSKIIAKIIFTPITMIINFIFMKILIEKI